MAIDHNTLEHLIALAEAHVEDWRTGLEDGTYDQCEGFLAAEQTLFSARAALAALEASPAAGVASPAPEDRGGDKSLRRAMLAERKSRPYTIGQRHKVWVVYKPNGWLLNPDDFYVTHAEALAVANRHNTEAGLPLLKLWRVNGE